MSREWKPGDVAIIPFSAGEERAMWLGDSWAVTGGRSQASGYAVRRPLVVIDPEDREAVERLARAHHAEMGGAPDEFEAMHFDATRAALREFANPTPPKPPADVTARITDRRDNIWRLLADGEWVCVDGPDTGEYLTWDALAADRGPLEVQS